MYYEVILQCTHSLNNLETCLDKAEQHAVAKKFDVGVLMTSRLAPDMQHLIYQVQSACDYVKAAAAWLSGQTPPKHADNEQTIDELRARIRKAVAFAESVKEAQYAGASERKVKLSWAPGKVIGGEDYLLQMTSPTPFSTSRWPTPSSATTASMSARWIFLVLSIWSTLDRSRCAIQGATCGLCRDFPIRHKLVSSAQHRCATCL